jgi:hypothetical protein
MRSTAVILLTCAPLLAWLPFSMHQTADANDDLFRTVSALDASVFATSTLQLQTQIYGYDIHAPDRRVMWLETIATIDDTWVVERISPTFSPRPLPKEHDQDGSGTFWSSEPRRYAAISDTDHICILYQDASLKLNADSSVLEEFAVYPIFKTFPLDERETMRPEFGLTTLAIGRGYSRFLNRVSHFETDDTNPDILHVTADGRYSSYSGEWKLDLQISTGMLVSRAVFSRLDSMTNELVTCLRIETREPAWFNGIALASAGSVYTGPNADADAAIPEFEVGVANYASIADTAFAERIRAELSGDPVTPSDTFDFKNGVSSKPDVRKRR